MKATVKLHLSNEDNPQLLVEIHIDGLGRWLSLGPLQISRSAFPTELAILESALETILPEVEIDRKNTLVRPYCMGGFQK